MPPVSRRSIHNHTHRIRTDVIKMPGGSDGPGSNQEPEFLTKEVASLTYIDKRTYYTEREATMKAIQGVNDALDKEITLRKMKERHEIEMKEREEKVRAEEEEKRRKQQNKDNGIITTVVFAIITAVAYTIQNWPGG